MYMLVHVYMYLLVHVYFTPDHKPTQVCKELSMKLRQWACVNTSTSQIPRSTWWAMWTLSWYIYASTNQTSYSTCAECHLNTLMVGLLWGFYRFNNLSVISQLRRERHPISEIEVARPGFKPRTPCSASKEHNHSIISATNTHGIFLPPHHTPPRVHGVLSAPPEHSDRTVGWLEVLLPRS